MTRARLVVLLGIDGSGKTSVTDEVTKRLSGEGIQVQALWARWEPYLLQPVRAAIRRLALGKRRHVEGKEEPNGISNLKASAFGRWRWVGMLYLKLALLDYWTQYRRRFRIALAEADLVVMDRYWYDLIVDAVGNSPTVAGRVADLTLGWWRRWFPRPDLVILLDVDEHTARSRKGGENPLEYLRLRRELYGRLAGSIDAMVVDASRPIEEVVADVVQAIRGLAQ